MKTPEAIDFLSQHGWLTFTSAAFRKQVLARLQLREFKRGEAVYRAGDAPGGLWVVLKGSAELELPAPQTVPHLVHFAAAGFWFGEWPLIHDKPRRMTVVASRPATLATLALADCRSILAEDPASWRWIALLSTMTSDLGAGMVADLLLRDPVKRTAAVLLRLSGVRSEAFGSTAPTPIYLSQEKLGQLANLSRNSIMPILSDFERRKYIEVGYGSILVTDCRALNTTISQ